ncbi:exopolysaccharide biosynthesis protein [Altererythrobacter sp. CAU 1778]
MSEQAGRGKSHESEPEDLEDVLESVEELGEENDEVCLGDALDTFGTRSFAPLLILLPIIEVSPIGGIPGVPTVLAVLIGLLALQMLIGREHVWLPEFVLRRGFDGDKLAKGAHKLDSMAEWIDDHLGDRLDWMVGKGGQKVAAIVILLLCLSVPPLEFLPFASSVPMLAVATIGLSLLLRDGLLMLIAMAVGGGSMIFALASFGSGGGGG